MVADDDYIRGIMEVGGYMKVESKKKKPKKTET